jgi:hypothetical protein
LTLPVGGIQNTWTHFDRQNSSPAITCQQLELVHPLVLDNGVEVSPPDFHSSSKPAATDRRTAQSFDFGYPLSLKDVNSS